MEAGSVDGRLKIQHSKRYLDGQFPETGGAPKELVVAVFNNLVGFLPSCLGSVNILRKT